MNFCISIPYLRRGLPLKAVCGASKGPRREGPKILYVKKVISIKRIYTKKTITIVPSILMYKYGSLPLASKDFGMETQCSAELKESKMAVR
jgi:hypothetical protein